MVTLTRAFEMRSIEITNQDFLELAQWSYDNGHVDASPTSLKDGLDGSTAELLDLDDPDCQIKFDYDISGGDTTGFFSLKDASYRNRPVVETGWFGAAAYCDWLSMRSELTRAYDHSTWLCNGGDPYGAEGYRLPTEAEWEYACRAGSETALANGPLNDIYCGVPEDSLLYRIGWYCGNSAGRSHAAAQLAPNAWGLYDMHGNVWEWCNDFYAADYYESSPAVDPTGPPDGDLRMLRGGYWSGFASLCRSASRPNFTLRADSQNFVGFRVVRTLD
jgi:formylglycine-generating enzyme required for sulfatase activity